LEKNRKKGGPQGYKAADKVLVLGKDDASEKREKKKLVLF